jgi:phage recombination protein Bet
MGEIAKLDNELVELEGIKITRGQIELIKRTIFIGATDDEMRLFFYECRRRGVHPMDRLIYPVSRKDKEGNRHVTFQMGIDYLRAAGEETGRYVGQKPIQYGELIKQATDEGEITVPEWAEATILRKDPESGEVADIPHQVKWREYYPGQKLGHMWRKMPHNQLAKCAEAGALRKAFPRKLGGLYINEEMEQAEAVPFTPISMPQEKKTDGEQPPKEQGEIIVSLVDGVTQSTGKKKDGKEWVKYTVNIGEKKYSTFSKSFADEAKQAQQSAMRVRIEFKDTQFGPEILHLQIEEPLEPGSQG